MITLSFFVNYFFNKTPQTIERLDFLYYFCPYLIFKTKRDD